MDQQYENKAKAAVNGQKPRIHTQCDTQSNHTQDQMDMKFDLSDNNTTHYQNQRGQYQQTSNLIFKEIKKYARIQECMEKITKIQIKTTETDHSSGRQPTSAVDALQDIMGQIYDKAVADNTSGSRAKTPHQEEIKSESQNTKHSVRYQQYTDDQNNNNDYKRQGNLFSTSSQIEHISQMSQKQPSSPVQSQFNHSEPNRFQGVADSSAAADSEGFKENLKLILGTLVDQIWKQKASQPNVIYINQKHGQTNKTPTQSQQNPNKVVQISKTARNRYKHSFESVENIEDFANDHINTQDQQMTISFKEQQYQDQDPLDVNTSLTESQKIRSKSMQKGCAGEHQKLQQQNLRRSTKKMPVCSIELRDGSELLNNEKLALRQERSENQPPPQTLLMAESTPEALCTPEPFEQNMQTKPQLGNGGQPGGQDYSFYNSNKLNANQPPQSVDSILSQNQQAIGEIEQSSSPRKKEDQRGVNDNTLNNEYEQIINYQEVQEVPEQAAQQIEGPEQYFREMPTTQRLQSANHMPGEAVAIDHTLESPDAKEIVRPEDINPSSNKKKNLLNESTDEEDDLRRQEAYNKEQILKQYQINRQGCLDDSSSSSYSNDENAQFRFAEKLNNFDPQGQSANPARVEYDGDLDAENGNDELQKSIDQKMQQQQKIDQEPLEEEEDDEEEEEYEQIQPNFMQMIKNENNKNTYRWEAPEATDSNAVKAQYDNIFSALTIEEADEDPGDLDNQRTMAAKALGRNESNENNMPPPPQVIEERQQQIDENDDQYEQQREHPDAEYQEENQIERVEQQDHYPSGYTNQLCNNKQFESVIEDVEAENKEYSDEPDSPGELSFDRAHKANQKNDLLDYEKQEADNAEIQSAATCHGNQYFDLLESKIEEKMKELLHKNASEKNLDGDENPHGQSVQTQNSIANHIEIEDIKTLDTKQTKLFLTDNNPVILLESEDGEDEAPVVSVHGSSPSKISQELNISKEEKLKRIIKMKNEFKKSQITNPRHSQDESNRGSITSRNSKERASGGQSIRMSLEKLLLGESVTSNTSLSKQDHHKKLSASKTEKLMLMIPNPGNSADKVRVVAESPRIMMNPRTNQQQAELLFSSGISKLSEVSFIKDSIIVKKSASILQTKESVKQNKVVQAIIDQAVTPRASKRDEPNKPNKSEKMQQNLNLARSIQLSPSDPKITASSATLRCAESSNLNLSFESGSSKRSRNMLDVSRISQSSRASKVSRTSNVSKRSTTSQGSSKIKAPTSFGKASKSARVNANYTSAKAEKQQEPLQQLNRSSSGLSIGSGSKQVAKKQAPLKSSVHSNYSQEMGIEALRSSITETEEQKQAAQKGDKGFLRSGFSAITSSLSRRLSYQPPQTKSAKYLKSPPQTNNVQQDEYGMPKK